MTWDELKTKPLDLNDLRNFMERVKNAPPIEPTYVVCLEDWKEIDALSKKDSISHFSAYLKLLNSGKVRPCFEQ